MCRLVFIVILLLGCNYVLSCEIEINGESLLFTKDFGSKTIVFKTHESKLILEEGETTNAFCRGIEVYKNYNYNYNLWESIESITGDTAAFQCQSNLIVVEGNSYNKIRVSCPGYPHLSLYESNKTLTKCTNFMNYALGFKLEEAGDVIKSAVCYDLDQLELKFASYVAHENKVLAFNKDHVDNELSVNLKQELKGFNKYFNFINEKAEVVGSPSEKLPFNVKEFQFDNLIQDETLKTELDDFKYIFNIMWWRQLLQENWRFFLDALSERTQTAKYVVHVGTFGNVTVPSTQGNCTTTKVVSIGSKDMVIRAPGYIWAYLKSITPGVEEEFVVIGHNSPYKKDPDHSEFCAVDMCDEIEWLKNSQFGDLRRLPTLGYTFCCRAEEVAKKIDYFPFKASEIATSTPQAWLSDYVEELMNLPTRPRNVFERASQNYDSFP